MDKILTVLIEGGDSLECYCPANVAVHERDRCIFDTGQVLDIGEITSIQDGEGTCAIRKAAMPVVLRCQTLQDQAKARENALMANMAMDTCRKECADLKLAMRLVSVRYSFDRKLLLVLFSADDRVDFRELLKRLSSQLHCRVEMRQIGVRDEAGMIGGLGPCGRVQCCSSWLRSFESVNVRMARVQGLSLNPSAISGMCGRLKCCLRYENEQYREALHGLPRKGALVETPDGWGKVIDVVTLERRLRVRLEDGLIEEYAVDDLQNLRNDRCKHRSDNHPES